MILYAEVPSFYAALERLRNPALQGLPIVVGGDPGKRGLVQSASGEALAAGVIPGMPMQEALARCPRARAVRTDMKHYREVSGRLRACLRAVAGALEPVGLESAYIDVAGRGEDPEDLGRRLIERVREGLDLSLRVGVASLKFLARLAAEEAAPGSTRRIAAGEEDAFLHPIPLGRLPGVGPKTADRLKQLGAETVADLLSMDPALLESELGNHGLRILELVQGREAGTVRGHRHPHSVSREQTFAEPQQDLGEMWDSLQQLAQLVADALQEQQLSGRRVVVKVRFDDQQRLTRSRTLAQAVTTASEIYPVAVALLDRTQAGVRAVRTLGVSVSGLGPRPSDQQLDLFS